MRGEQVRRSERESPVSERALVEQDGEGGLC